jgi:cytochrome c oxidase subunit 3/cytochrome o ubiquinol oxidase subunit 3
MVLALAAIRRGDHRRVRLWLAMTALFGMIFVGGQIFEFTEFYREGFTISGNLNGSTFFVLTGLHGLHVTAGIVWLATLWSMSLQNRLSTEHEQKVETAGLYWHFVDVIWIVIFMIVYLVPAPG